eukprot:gene15498-21582_t
MDMQLKMLSQELTKAMDVANLAITEAAAARELVESNGSGNAVSAAAAGGDAGRPVMIPTSTDDANGIPAALKPLSQRLEAAEAQLSGLNEQWKRLDAVEKTCLQVPGMDSRLGGVQESTDKALAELGGLNEQWKRLDAVEKTCSQVPGLDSRLRGVQESTDKALAELKGVVELEAADTEKTLSELKARLVAVRNALPSLLVQQEALAKLVAEATAGSGVELQELIESFKKMQSVVKSVFGRVEKEEREVVELQSASLAVNDRLEMFLLELNECKAAVRKLATDPSSSERTSSYRAPTSGDESRKDSLAGLRVEVEDTTERMAALELRVKMNLHMKDKVMAEMGTVLNRVADAQHDAVMD